MKLIPMIYEGGIAGGTAQQVTENCHTVHYGPKGQEQTYTRTTRVDAKGRAIFKFEPTIHANPYKFPQETWDAAKCAKLVKHVHRDGLGTKYGFPGYVGHLIPASETFNGGTTRFGNGDWYPGIEQTLPILAPGYKLVTVPTWGLRIVADLETPRPSPGPLRVGVYARVKATGQAGRVGAKYRDGKRVTWGLDYGDEYAGAELERITPDEYHAAANKLPA